MTTSAKIPIHVELEPWQTWPSAPPLVRAAMAKASRLGFEHSCTPEVGRLLAVLAGSIRHGRIGEIGTGCGVGTAWLASGRHPGVRIDTIDSESSRTRAVRELAIADLRVWSTRWESLLDKGPFDLLFIDAKPAKAASPNVFLPALRRGGLVLLDDLTPYDLLPAKLKDRLDPVRDAWLGHPGYRAAELRISHGMSVILAAKA